MEQTQKQKMNRVFARFRRRFAALALAAALALSLCGCEELAAGLSDAVSAVLSDAAAAVSGGTTISAPATTPQTLTLTDAPLSVHFMDVGQALSVLVECEGEYLLYDGGNVDDGSLVVSYLQQRGVERLEYVFCSHAHEDHVGGLAAVLAAFPAGHVYSPVTQAELVCFTNFVQGAQQQGLSVEMPAAGTVWLLGGATVQLLGPLKDYEDTNNTSLVLRIDYGEASFLLTGDMEAEAERDLVDSGANLKADVLQVGHHGSYSSTSYVFLNAVLPEMAVISCGANNDYGHPHEEPLSRLRDAGADTYRTDLMGTIVIQSDGANYTVASERTASDEQLNPTAAILQNRHLLRLATPERCRFLLHFWVL